MRVTFDRFVLDSDRRELRDGPRPVHLPPKTFQLLELLVANAPRVLSKRELHDAIWPGTFVDESTLAGLVKELRAALGDRPRDSRFVRTVHGFGYAFCGEPTQAALPRPAGVLVFQGTEHRLHPGANILGREPSAADIQVDDKTVSRRHARLSIVDDAVTLEDLDSKNGTFVDGVRITDAVVIADGQSFVLGDVSLIFRRTVADGTTVTLA